MSPRKIGEVLVPSIVISILIVLVAANQVVQSAPVDRVPDIHTEFTVDQQSASTALRCDHVNGFLLAQYSLR